MMWVPKFAILILSFVGYCTTVKAVTPLILKQMKSALTVNQAMYNPGVIIGLLLLFSMIAGLGLRWGKT